jgi:hypothetical protein
MATTRKPKSPIVVLADMGASEKLSTRKLEDAFADLEPSTVREWIDALEEFCSAWESAADAFEAWQYAEGRDEKADARDTLLDALQAIDGSSLAVDLLDPIPELRLGFGIAPDALLIAASRAGSVKDLLDELELTNEEVE